MLLSWTFYLIWEAWSRFDLWSSINCVSDPFLETSCLDSLLQKSFMSWWFRKQQWHWIWFPTVFYIAHKLHQCHHFPILMQISLYLTTNLHSTSLLQWFWLQWSPGPYHCNLAPLSFVPHVHFPSGIHHIPFQDHSIQTENATSIEIQAHGY